MFQWAMLLVATAHIPTIIADKFNNDWPFCLNKLKSAFTVDNGHLNYKKMANQSLVCSEKMSYLCQSLILHTVNLHSKVLINSWKILANHSNKSMLVVLFFSHSEFPSGRGPLCECDSLDYHPLDPSF